MRDSEDARYPVGRFERLSAPVPDGELRRLIDEIGQTPRALELLVAGLSEAALDTRYREGGWTIRQVVHHLPDSHLNAYVRMKLAVTEEAPLATTYDEVGWAELPDGRAAPIHISLELLDALHRRWVSFLRALSREQFSRCYVHPEMGEVRLDEVVANYAWHGRHHLAHIRQALASRR